MTSEVIEAIEYIKTYRKLDENLYNTAPKGSVSFYATEKCLHYWDMAIKALEQEQYYKDLAESYEKTINKLTKAISEQEPKTEWIPCSERLPEKTGKYLVTVKNGNVYAGVFDAFRGKFQCAAIAWQPLPEAYKEGDTDDNMDASNNG